MLARNARSSARLLALATITLPLLTAPAALAELRLAPDSPLQIDPALRLYDESVAARRLLITRPDGERILPLLIDGSVSTAALEAIGIQVQTDVGGYRTALVPESALAELVVLPGVQRLMMGFPLKKDLSDAVPNTNADDKRSSSPPLAGWNGTGVVVGIVDTGLDVRHDDFEDALGDSRIQYLWDQNAVGTPPAGFAYGTEWTKAQIDAGTCTHLDQDGHGTHVTGIAAGDGSATGNGELAYRYVGMANAADIVMVATNFSFSGVVDGVSYVFQKAAALGKPAVVNLSLGTEIGPHDGSLPWEDQLDALTGSGKILCVSAGNAQDDAVHASANISATADSFLISVSPYTAVGGAGNDFIAADLWHDQANAYTVRVRTPNGTVVGPVSKGGFLQSNTVQGRVLIDYQFTVNPNGQSEIYVEMNDEGGTAPASGTWRIVLHPAGVPGDPKVHDWMVASLGSSSPAFPFFSTKVDSTVNVNTPGTSDSAITVAAFTTKRTWTAIDLNVYQFVGSVNPFQICPFSARGPRRDGVQKPDLAAPGSAIGSSLSGDALPPYPTALTLPDGQHVILQGTSMSSPMTAGAVAMLLQKYPTLSPSGAKQLLYAGARSDATTGAVPNPRWGYGRLDLASLLCNLDVTPPSVTLANPLSPGPLYTGTPSGINWSTSDVSPIEYVTIDYRIGTGGSWTTIASPSPNDGHEGFTVPGTVTDSLEVRVRAYDCLSNEGTGTSGWLVVLAPSVAADGDLPLSFAAYRPIPNPFTARSSIRFDLPSAPGGTWPVDVSVYSVAGRKVRTIVREPLAAGRYSYDWDGRDDGGVRLAAGVYFLQILAGPHSARDRIVYLR